MREVFNPENYPDTCIDHGRTGYNHKGKRGMDDGYARSRAGITSGRLLHRHLFAFIHGHTPEVVMHTCDNQRCINPKHLVAGTNVLNSKDRAAKDRGAKVQPKQRKLTDDEVRAIRARWALRTTKWSKANSAVAIAKDFGVSDMTVHDIGRNRGWYGQVQ